MRVKLIVNPWADRGRVKIKLAQIEALAAAYKGLDVTLTEGPGHARRLARDAADAGYDVVAAGGGDGTVHEVVNGLVHGSRADVPLGIVPIGSGNDLAHALGIPMEIPEAVAGLFAGQRRTIDLLRIEDGNGRYQVVDNNVGIGFDAQVVIQTENLTRVHGFMMYLMATLHTIAFYYQTPRLDIRFDDEQVSQRALFMALGVGPRGGGGFHLTPDARHDDDLIDSCLVNPIGRLTMLGMLTQAIKGTHVNSRHVTMRQNRRIVVHSDAPMPIHVDGEMFAYPKDNVRHVTMTSLPAAIDVVVPVQPNADAEEFPLGGTHPHQ